MNGKSKEMQSLWSLDSTLSPMLTRQDITPTEHENDVLLQTPLKTAFKTIQKTVNNSITVKTQQKSYSEPYFSCENLQRQSCYNRISLEKQERQTFSFPWQGV